MIDIQKFCATDNENIAQPWTRGIYTYATNGHVLIRVPARPEFSDNPKAPEGVSRAIAMYDISGPSFDIPELPQPRKIACRECGGARKGFRCPECYGTGEVDWESDRHEYTADCKECGGEGRIAGECQICEGTGKLEIRFGVKINGVSFDRGYLAMLKELPGIKIYPHPVSGIIGVSKASTFTFDGGDGIIMPRNE